MCTHHTHTYLLSTTSKCRLAGGRGDGKKAVGEGCWLCPVWSTEHCTCSLWELQISHSPSKHRALKAALKCGGLWCMCACWCNETQKSISLSEWLTFLSSIMQALIFLTEFSDSLQLALWVGEPSSKNTEITWSLTHCAGLAIRTTDQANTWGANASSVALNEEVPRYQMCQNCIPCFFYISVMSEG